MNVAGNVNSAQMAGSAADSTRVYADGAPAPGFELADILRILSEQRRIILGAGVIGLILGIIASLVMTPLYRATALLEMNDSAAQMIDGATRTGQNMAARGGNQELLATQIGLLKSEALAQRVAQDLNLANAPDYGGDQGTREQRTKRAVGNLMNGTDISAVKGSLLIQVSAMSPRIPTRLPRSPMLWRRASSPAALSGDMIRLPLPANSSLISSREPRPRLRNRSAI